MKDEILNEYLNFLYEQDENKESEEEKIKEKGKKIISKIPDTIKKQIVLASDDVPPIIYNILKNRSVQRAAMDVV